MTKFLKLLLLLLFPFVASAQEPQMADAFRQDGKIYIVITVLVIVFLCLTVYLVMMERKLKKLEKEFKDKIKN